MEINIVKQYGKIYDNYVIPQFHNDIKIYSELTEKEKLVLEKLIEKEKFTGKKNSSISCNMMYNNKLINIIYVGFGKKEELEQKDIINGYYNALKNSDGETIIASAHLDISIIVEAIYYSKYRFNKYKTDKKDKKYVAFDIFENETKNSIDEGRAIAEAVLLTRDLVNEPANVIFPESLANIVSDLGKENNFEVEIFEEDKIKELGMVAYLSVARASAKRPRFIVMRYFGDPQNRNKIKGLVGKGLTYDTGGLSLKPSDSMVNMKTDMGGAATVIGVMLASAKMKIKENLVVVIAACENSIGGNAYRPGDIIGSMSGKTIEVGNTDAEGRLTLVDALYYIIHKEKVDEVIDVATLTGTVLVTLGTTTTGALSNSDSIYKKIEEAAKLSGERLWRLPNFPEYKKLYKSEIADFKNIGGRYAGTITAGMFIEEFVGATPWVHLDIAGTSTADKPYDYYSVGGTGQMVKTLYNYYKK